MTAVAEGPAATTSAVTPEVALERATKWANDYAARLTERAEHRLAELAGHSNGNVMRPRIGEPTTGDPTTGFYVGFDVVATSPIQFGGPPPYQPGKVIAAGPGARGEDGKLQPMGVKAGDKVLFGKWSGTEVKIDGDELLIMKESDIMGILA